MASNPYIAGFSKVLGGWTGLVATTIGVTTASITPTGRESAISVWNALIKKSRLTHGGTWNGWVDSDGKLYIESSLSFDLTHTNLTRSRLGFASDSTSITSITAPSAHSEGYYPKWVSFDGMDRIGDSARPVNGATGSIPLTQVHTSPNLEIMDTYSNIYTWQTVFAPSGYPPVFDLHLGGRELGRYLIEDARLFRPFKTMDYASLDLKIRGNA